MATAQHASPRTLGAVVSHRWRGVSKLGEGGMGEVFAAEPLDGGPRVAIKVLRQEFVADPQVMARFLEEARTSIRLVHPNIVRVLEGAQAEDGAPFLVMELLDGVPLSAYTKNGGRVPLHHAVPILQGILAGLAAAHAQGIVHRDLKPDNVLLARDASGAFMVKVLDFGIAKVMDVAGGMGVRTRTGMLLGTPAYMSPEQARNARDVDQRADLWSAGVLFYEMLTGRAAFPAPTEFARLAALLSQDPEPVQYIDPNLGPLSGFFERALKKDRAERFGSAVEMARALAAAVPSFGRPSTSPMPLSNLPEVPAAYVQSGSRPRTTANPDVPRPSNAPPTAAMPSTPGPPAPKTTPVPAAPQGHLTPPGGLLPGGIGQVPATTPLGQNVGIGIGAPPAVLAVQSPPAKPSPGGTLASPVASPFAGAGAGAGAAAAEPPAINVAFAVPKSSFGETLPSKGAPSGAGSSASASRGAIATPIVAVLVLAALVAGFLLGWAFARM
jgi:serine/threonine-protein kinase